MKLSEYRRRRRMETCQHPVAQLQPQRLPDGFIRTYRCPLCGCCGDMLPYLIRPIPVSRPGERRRTLKWLLAAMRPSSP